MKKTVSILLCLMLAFSTTLSVAAATSAITPGTYMGTAAGMWGDFTVEVTLDNSSITGIQVISQNDTKHIANAAIDDITSKVMASQSCAVDATSGATVSAYGMIYAIRNALESANALDAFSSKVPVVEKTAGEEESYDLVIVGGGGSGLSAAAHAKKAGVQSVLVLEKIAWTGGSTSISGGGSIVGGSRYNKLAGVDYTPEEYLNYFVEAAKNAENRPENMWINEALVHKIGSITGSTFDAFMDADFPFPDEFWSNPANAAVWGDWGVEGHGLISFNYDAGALYHTWLTQYVENCGAEIRTLSEVTSLVVEDGAVVGVTVEGPESAYTVRAKKVILACGGMENNPELLKIYAPEAVGMSLYACPGNTGDFIALTESLDPSITGYGSVAQAGPDRMHASLYGGSLMALSMMVNSNGERFMEENVKYYKRGRGVNAQDGNYAWGIADSANPYVEYLEQDVSNGKAYKADTLEELAGLIGVPAEKLVASAAQFHTEYEASSDPLNVPIGACPKYDVSVGPFYAQTIYPLLMFTLTGLEVDENCHVLNNSGAAIGNLYAVGEIVFGNCFYDHYVCGSSAVQISINSGRIAGESAAAEIVK